MSKKDARTHTSASNRAKANDRMNRRAVFKSVLDNPYRIQWPLVPLNLQNTLFARLMAVLDGVSDYHRTRDRLKKYHKKRSREAGHEAPKKRRIADVEASGDILCDSIIPGGVTDTGLPCQPAVLQHLIVGINEVTRKLESQTRSVRAMVKISVQKDSTPADSRPPIKLVFACRADIDPPILINHLPHLVAAHNSSKPAEPIYLVPLPKESEYVLAVAMGLRRVAVIGFDAASPALQTFLPLLDNVPLVTATWLSPQVIYKELIPTHVKQVCTSAPIDMKIAKEKRTLGRASAKAKRKLN